MSHGEILGLLHVLSIAQGLIVFFGGNLGSYILRAVLRLVCIAMSVTVFSLARQCLNEIGVHHELAWMRSFFDAFTFSSAIVGLICLSDRMWVYPSQHVFD